MKEDASFGIDLGFSAQTDFDFEVELRTEISINISKNIAEYLKSSSEFNDAVYSQNKEDVLLIICKSIRELLGNDAANAFEEALTM